MLLGELEHKNWELEPKIYLHTKIELFLIIWNYYLIGCSLCNIISSFSFAINGVTRFDLFTFTIISSKKYYRFHNLLFLRIPIHERSRVQEIGMISDRK